MPETVDTVVVGVTTEEELILKLGEPDEVSFDQKLLRYQWSKIKVLWAVVGPYYMNGGGGIRDYTLSITFDDNNVVSKKEFSARWRHY